MGVGEGLEQVSRGQAWSADVIQRVATLVPLMVATLLGNVVIIVVLTCSRRHNISSRVNIFISNPLDTCNNSCSSILWLLVVVE